MTIAAVTPVTNSVAVAAQTIFAFGWRCDDSTTVRVNQKTVLLAPTQYAVARNADQISNPGGTVTLSVAASAGDSVVISRSSPLAQLLALIPFGAFPATAIMLALDRIVMLVQELAARIPVPGAPGVSLVMGQQLVDLGNSQSFQDPAARRPVGANALYLNGQRIFLTDDYTYDSVNAIWNLNNPISPGDKVNADFNY